MSEALPPRHDVHAVFQKTHASASRLKHLIYLRKPSQTMHFSHSLYLRSYKMASEMCHMLFLSPRINLEDHLNVLEGADYQIFLRAKSTNIELILGKRAMRTSVVPQLERFLADFDQYHVLFGDLQNTVSYLGQWKIQRKRTYATYKKEIEKIFKSADDANEQFGSGDLPRLDFFDEKCVACWLVRSVAEIAGIADIDMDQDLFAAGIDSLQIMQMSRALRFQARRAGLGKIGADDFLPGSIYKNPTLNRLKTFIFRQAGAKGPAKKRTIDGIVKQQAQDLNRIEADHQLAMSTSESARALFQQYATNLPHLSQSSLPAGTKDMTVILTCSTGSLGFYLLEALCRDSNVSNIICLNRSGNASERHRQIDSQRGLNSIDWARVAFLKADLSKAWLGLELSVYKHLCSIVTHVIHNQWPVNFNWTLASFEPYIRGVRNLVDFSVSSTHRSFLLFVSSVSAVGAWSGPGFVSEEPYHNFNVAGELGYGQSKLISECLLDEAARMSGVRPACCRVGIVAGPVEKRSGLWNKHEYIASLIVSSAALGAFPVTFPSRERIDWLPVDKLSKAIMEIMSAASREARNDFQRGTLMYHVVNPNASSWTSLAPNILNLYPKSSSRRAVQYRQWVEALGNSADELLDPERNPAVKLLDFYQKAAIVGKEGPRMLPSHKAEAASKTLRSVGAVKEGWVKLWMQQWGILENQSK
ncbi:MAG: hypothetical protein Q9172_005770 [Xanthocarpia lactea]